MYVSDAELDFDRKYGYVVGFGGMGIRAGASVLEVSIHEVRDLLHLEGRMGEGAYSLVTL